MTSTPTATSVVACATFGYGSVGGSVISSGALANVAATRFNLPSYSNVTGLTVNLKNASGNAVVRIYNDSSGVISTLAVASTSKAVANGWNAFTLSPTVLYAGYYWLAVYIPTVGVQVAYNTGGSSIAWVNGSTPSGGTSVSGTLSIYADYCLLPTFTPTWTSTDTTSPTPTPSFTPTNSKTFTVTSTPMWTNTGTSTPCVYPGLIGESALDSTGGDCGIYAQRCQLLQSGVVYGIKIYTSLFGNPYYVGIYADASGEPGALLATSPTLYGQMNTWVTVDIPDISLPAGYYWLAVGRSGTTGNFSVGLATNLAIQARRTQACTSNLPAVFPATTPIIYSVAMQALYCAPGPAISPTRTLTPTPTPISTQVTTCGFYGQTASTARQVGVTNYTFTNKQGLPGGYAQRMRILMNSANAAMQVGLYADSGGSPGDLLTTSTSQAVTAGWNTLAINPVFIGSGDYWVAWSSPGGEVMYQAGGSYAFRYKSGVFSDPFGSSWDSYGMKFAMEVEICP